MSVALGLGFVRPKSPALPAEVLSWNKQNFGRGLMVLPNSDISYSREGVHPHDVGAIQSRDKIPRSLEIFYFEVEIIDLGERGTISLGFADGTSSSTGIVGMYDSKKMCRPSHFAETRPYSNSPFLTFFSYRTLTSRHQSVKMQLGSQLLWIPW